MSIFIYLVFAISYAKAEFYEDSRCSCVVLSPDASGNHVKTFYQENHITPEKCNCKDMVLPRVESKMNASWLTFCINCECNFETRNTTMVMVVVILLCVIISFLMLYMVSLKILQKIVTKRKTVFHHSTDDKELRVLLNGTCPNTSDVED